MTTPLIDAVGHFLLTIDAYPPEVSDMSGAWRIGGTARDKWVDAVAELRGAHRVFEETLHQGKAPSNLYEVRYASDNGVLKVWSDAESDETPFYMYGRYLECLAQEGSAVMYVNGGPLEERPSVGMLRQGLVALTEIIRDHAQDMDEEQYVLASERLANASKALRILEGAQ